MDPVTGFCYGCARTNIEKKKWKDETTSEYWKEENLKKLRERMKGWQLETFNTSYKHKIFQGISIYKKNALEKKD